MFRHAIKKTALAHTFETTHTQLNMQTKNNVSHMFFTQADQKYKTERRMTIAFHRTNEIVFS